MRDFLMRLFECSVSMSVIALALMVLTPVLSKRYAAKWIYNSWLVVVIGLVIPYRVCVPVEFLRQNTAPLFIRQVLPKNIESAVATAAPVAVENQVSQAVPWIRILGALWFAGAVVSLAYHIFRHVRFAKLVKRWEEPAENPQVTILLEKIKKEMGIAGPIKLLICPCISSPMMTGFRSPVLLLPRSDYSAEELSYFYRHELLHYKRKDLWYKSLVILATAIHWFNPVVYWMARAIALQCEISCDAEVVKGTGLEARQRYSEAILRIIKEQPKVRTVFSTNFYTGKAGVRKRFFSILDTKKKKAGILILCLILIGTLSTGTVFATRRDAGSEWNASRSDMIAPIQKAAGQWAEAVKKRDGRAQYNLLSSQCQSTVYEDYQSRGWQTGQSSPWVENYEISVNGTKATVTYQYAASTGLAGNYEQTLSFVKQDGRFCIASFSNPREISADSSGGTAYASKVKAFLGSAEGIGFQDTANRFVKSYLIGDVRMMKRCLKDPESGQNDFSMDGKTVSWRSLALKIAPEGIGKNSVTAEYEIILKGGGVQKMYFNMGKAGQGWRVNSYRIEK